MGIWDGWVECQMDCVKYRKEYSGEKAGNGREETGRWGMRPGCVQRWLVCTLVSHSSEPCCGILSYVLVKAHCSSPCPMHVSSAEMRSQLLGDMSRFGAKGYEEPQDCSSNTWNILGTQIGAGLSHCLWVRSSHETCTCLLVSTKWDPPESQELVAWLRGPRTGQLQHPFGRKYWHSCLCIVTKSSQILLRMIIWRRGNTKFAPCKTVHFKPFNSGTWGEFM